MSSPLKNVAVIGASGNIGKIILNGLLASSQFSITVVTREESEATFPSGVVVRKTDFSATDLEAAFKGKDAVISAVGASALGDQKKYVDAAIRAGVQRFLPSEFSSSCQDEAVLKLLPLFGQKTELIEYLKTKEADGLTWTGVASSCLFDWGLNNGLLGFNIANRTATIWDGGNKKFSLTNEKQLAQAVISVLQRPQETRNKYLHVASVETSQKKILAALEVATGAQWTVSDTTTEAEVSAAVKKLSEGDFSGAFTLVVATVYSNTPGLRANYVKDEKLANELLGLELGSVPDAVERVVKN